MFLLYYSSGYFFVYNNNAYVSADVVRIAPGVSGIVDEVSVTDNEFVTAGSLLLSLQQAPFLLAVQTAQAQLEKVLVEQKNLNTETAEALSEVKINEARNKLAAVEFKRYQKLLKSGNISQQKFDEEQEQYRVTQLEIAQAKQAYQLSLQQAAIYAAEVKDLQSVLGLTKYRLKISKIYAPQDGYVNNLKVYAGGYANSGDTLFGFVGHNTTRIVANIKDTNLAMLHKDKPVWVYLSSYPWQIFRGKVESIGRGVSRTKSLEKPALPYIEPVTNWIRYSYRIPVRITLTDFPKDETAYVGIDARVLVFR
ncbi:MAG: HlyD family secretion protein [Sneathiella sp.]